MGIIASIKESAKNSGAVIQSSEAHDLELVLNKALFLPKKPEEAEFVRQVMTRGLKTQERKGLHASALIASDNEFCIRAQVLSLVYKQAQDADVSIALKRIFEQGNAIHEKWQRMFLRAGWSDVSQLDVTQFNKQYKVSYTPDIICFIPEFYKGLMVGEIKSVNTFQFQKMVHHPSAGKQLMWYLYLTGIKKGFVLSEDKNTQAIKLEVYDYDESKVSTYIERCESIMYYYHKLYDEHRMVARPDDASGIECKKCRSCNMKYACWNVGMGRIKL